MSFYDFIVAFYFLTFKKRMQDLICGCSLPIYAFAYFWVLVLCSSLTNANLVLALIALEISAGLMNKYLSLLQYHFLEGQSRAHFSLPL